MYDDMPADIQGQFIQAARFHTKAERSNLADLKRTASPRSNDGSPEGAIDFDMDAWAPEAHNHIARILMRHNKTFQHPRDAETHVARLAVLVHALGNAAHPGSVPAIRHLMGHHSIMVQRAAVDALRWMAPHGSVYTSDSMPPNPRRRLQSLCHARGLRFSDAGTLASLDGASDGPDAAHVQQTPWSFHDVAEVPAASSARARRLETGAASSSVDTHTSVREAAEDALLAAFAAENPTTVRAAVVHAMVEWGWQAPSRRLLKAMREELNTLATETPSHCMLLCIGPCHHAPDENQCHASCADLCAAQENLFVSLMHYFSRRPSNLAYTHVLEDHETEGHGAGGEPDAELKHGLEALELRLADEDLTPDALAHRRRLAGIQTTLLDEYLGKETGFDEIWGADDLGAYAKLVLSAEARLRIGLFGGEFSVRWGVVGVGTFVPAQHITAVSSLRGLQVTVSNELKIGAYMFGLDLVLVHGQMAVIGGFAFKSLIPSSLLKALSFIGDIVRWCVRQERRGGGYAGLTLRVFAI